jgi:1A family penicillin-binding protein
VFLRYHQADLLIVGFFKKITKRIYFLDQKIRKKFKMKKNKNKTNSNLIHQVGRFFLRFTRKIIKKAERLLIFSIRLWLKLFKKIILSPFSIIRFFTNSKKLVRFKQIFLLVVFSILITSSIVIYIFFKSLPDVNSLKERKYPMTTKILDRKGRLLYKIYKNQNRTLIHLSDLPKYVAETTIAIEDKGFYRHFGVSPRGIIRAFLENKKEGGTVQGGSTITQQLVKNALLSPERTIDRKIKEVVLAILVERRFTKNQILEMYFNEVPYGGTAYGIEEAAQMYFGVPAKKLSLGQAALLAGLPASPTDFSPYGASPEISKTRQLEVLRNMISMKYITKEEAEKAEREKLVFNKQKIEIKAPHFVFFVKDELEKKYGTEFVNQGGLTIQTTLNLDIQNMAQKEVEKGVEEQKYLLVGNGAAVVEDPQNGEILAMVGSRDYFDTEHDGNVNVAVAARQPGSSIKPVTYALALSSGLYTPSTIIDDAPITYHTEGSPPYSPINYDNKFHGKVTIRTALACSYNVPIVKILSTLGVSRLIDFAEKLGITTWTDRSRFGYSLTLGGGEVKLIDMAKVFSVFANQGKKVEQKYILKITNPQGKVIENNTLTKSERVLSPIVSFQISDILADNSARTPAFGPMSSLVIPNHTVSVKTGTTDSKKDNWTIGYTKDYTVAVWIGNNDNTPMSFYLESGNTGAAAIWNPIMKNLLNQKKDQKLSAPEELILVDICKETGTLPCPGCTVQKEYFIRGSEPKDRCEKYEAPTPTPTNKP